MTKKEKEANIVYSCSDCGDKLYFKIKEMELSKSNSFCCGAGGGNMWYEIKTGDRINQNRVKQAVDTKSKTVAAACNFCNIMLEDGVKTTQNEENIRVLDIAEMVSKGLTEKTM